MSTDQDKIDWPEGVGRIVLDEVDSTNAEAARCAASLTQPTWIMTRRQTKGRGRRGRPWADPTGNFAATLLMFPQEPLHQMALNSFVAAVSLRQALEVLAPSGGYALKWPNDVLLNDRKIAGILLESTGAAQRADWLAIGIGVNLAHAPSADAVEQRALAPSSISAELGVEVPPEELLNQLALAFDANRTRFLQSGFDPIRRDWLAHAARRGQEITARTQRSETTGIFEDIDSDGNLILNTPVGRERITAADIFF